MQIGFGGYNRFMIQFDSRKQYHKKPFGAIRKNADLFLRIKAVGAAPSISAALFLHCDENGSVARIEGKRSSDSIFVFSLQIDTIGLYFYRFEVVWQDGSRDESPFHQLTVFSEDYETPRWLKTGVMYQVFPDRFARSHDYQPPQQDKNYVYREDWGGLPTHEPDEQGIVQNNDFFGGNLRGIVEKLDYLEWLGITVLYLNPIFEAYSNHRYDTADYKKIDPMLGTEEDFIELCRKAEKKGIRVILDGVFNHTGSDSVYFNKKGRYPDLGAYQSRNSPYYKWYHFIEFPDQYASWWGIDTLPSVNETEPSLLDYMIRSEDSVVRHWLRCGASGFRLDVADELPDGFLEALRSGVKECKPDAAVIGEVWEDASNKIAYGLRRKYFWGNQLDSVMNYPLKNAVIDYLLHRKNGPELAEIVNSIWENYPEPAFGALMNILGTHDTRRIFTVLSETSRDDAYTRQRLFLAVLIISFMPGIPCVYYGDEIGMRGEKDPFNRMCFQPENGDPLILRFYRRLFAFRKRIDGLEEHAFLPREADGSFYSYSRAGEGGRLIIAINAGSQDYLLNLAMKDKEDLKDFLISGSVLYERQGVFRIKENSGIAAYIRNL